MLRKDGQQRYLTVFGGYMEVSDDKVTVLVEVAEDMAEIDAQRAGAARDRALERLNGRGRRGRRPSTAPAPRCSGRMSACRSASGEAEGLENETPDVPGAWRLTLHQNLHGYRFALDAFLLADFVPSGSVGPVIELGTGCGIVACLLARRFPAASIVGLELQASLAAAAQRNVMCNGLARQVSILRGDMRCAVSCLVPARFAAVVCNPPYRAMGQGRLNPNAEKAIARHEVAVTPVRGCACCPAPFDATRPLNTCLSPIPPRRVMQPAAGGRPEPPSPPLRPTQTATALQPWFSSKPCAAVGTLLRCCRRWPSTRRRTSIAPRWMPFFRAARLPRMGESCPEWRQRIIAVPCTSSLRRSATLRTSTLRALRILGTVDLIAAEDTRHTRKLLTHYDISCQLLSYHDHNKVPQAQRLLGQLQEGRTVALVTDAGTPGIADPAYHLLQVLLPHDIPVVPIPGPAAAIAALSVSGLPMNRFVFEGFLPIQERPSATTPGNTPGRARAPWCSTSRRTASSSCYGNSWNTSGPRGESWWRANSPSTTRRSREGRQAACWKNGRSAPCGGSSR